jgi:xylan 1,4-beta-xylosidase
VDVLLWNYHDDDVAADAAQVRLVVNGLPIRGELKVQKFLMDEEHSNAYSLWQKMGSPGKPSAKQFQELQRADNLQSPAPVAQVMQDKQIELPVRLERQGVMLVRLSW